MSNFKWGSQPKSQSETADDVFARIHRENAAMLQEPEAPKLAHAFISTEQLYQKNKVGDSFEQEKFLIHRSAILSYKACPMKYYLEYAWGGHGVSHHRIEQHLLIGICIHRGLQHLLEHCRVEHPDGSFEEKCIDDAIMWAHKVFTEIISKRELALKKSFDKTMNSWIEEDLNYTVKEIYALIEVLIRVYASYRLPSLLDEYEILEVEKEEVFDDFSEIVTWLGKADGLLRRKSDNALIVLSFKTASDFSKSTMSNILIDMQGCSEIVAIEERLNRIKHKLKSDSYQIVKDAGDTTYVFDNESITKGLFDYIVCTHPNRRIEVFANQYEYLVKGKHRADSTSPTFYKYQTHLLHPIKSGGGAAMQLGSGLKFGSGIYLGQSEYEWVIPQGKLPAGKHKINIVDDIGIKAWVDMLARLEVQPEKGHPFESVVYAGEERLAARTQEQLKEWRISTQFEAEEIAGYLAVLNNIAGKIDACEELNTPNIEYLNDLKELAQVKLLQFFSRDGKDAQLCYDYYGGSCPFTSHCHESVSIEDGLESGLYIMRIPHHQLEVERFIKKGWLKEDE